MPEVEQWFGQLFVWLVVRVFIFGGLLYAAVAAVYWLFKGYRITPAFLFFPGPQASSPSFFRHKRTPRVRAKESEERARTPAVPGSKDVSRRLFSVLAPSTHPGPPMSRSAFR